MRSKFGETKSPGLPDFPPCVKFGFWIYKHWWQFYFVLFCDKLMLQSLNRTGMTNSILMNFQLLKLLTHGYHICQSTY